MIAQVYVNTKNLNIDKPFDYLVPEAIEDKIAVGCRVKVPFGTGNLPKEAYVTELKNVSSFEEGVFRWSPIRTLIIRGTFPEELRSDTFYGMDEETTVIYVQRSEIEKFKKVFTGTVLPLEEYGASDIKSPDVKTTDASPLYDLTGRPVAAPAKGIYIQNGKKVMVK